MAPQTRQSHLLPAIFNFAAFTWFSLGRGHDDLDDMRRLQFDTDAGPHWRIDPVYPLVPGAVHFALQRHAVDIDDGRQILLLSVPQSARLSSIRASAFTLCSYIEGVTGSDATATVNTRPSWTTARLRVGVRPGKRLIMANFSSRDLRELTLQRSATAPDAARRRRPCRWRVDRVQQPADRARG